jgi:hypothetical protein
MHARGIFTVVAFKKLTPQSLFFITIFIFITALSLTIPRLALAQGPPDWVADELLVGLRPGVSQARAQAIYRAHGAAFIDRIPQINTHLIRVPAHALEKVQQALSRRPEVEVVEPNFIAEGSYTPSDERYPSQWHLPRISAPQGWDISTGSESVTIAIIDSGVDPNHPDLSAKLVPGYNFVENNTDTQDILGHGTMVAGCAAAASDNTEGVAGVAWQNPIMPLVVLNSNSWATYYDIARAITYSADNGVRVMNISIGGTSSSTTLQNAADYAWNLGALIFACAHNYNTSDPYYPAACNNVVAVAATTSNDSRASFSNYGEWVDISAPGSSILTTTRGGGYAYGSGTSFASPLAAGLAGLIISANPSLSNAQVVEIIELNVDDLGEPGFDPFFGWGRINVYASLIDATSSAPAEDTTAPLVSVGAPEDGSVVSAITTVSVWATDDTTVAVVELYIDGSLLATDTTTPFNFNWNTAQSDDGLHTIQAMAYDAAGNRGESDVVAVTVDNTVADTTPPEASIVSPADGDIVSGTISVSVSASDDIGVAAVELYLDGALLSTDNTAPFSFTWDTATTADGTHTLQARAYDAASNVEPSIPVAVEVSNSQGDTESPTAPLRLSASVKGKNVKLTWGAATDNVGVTGYAVWRDDARIGDTAETGYTDNSLTAGMTCTYTVSAFDAAGNTSAPSNSVTVTFTEKEHPGKGKPKK